jgi:hypothetical protein
MSFLEIRKRGLPFGSIPYKEIVGKLEETDMNLSEEDFKSNYDNYMRSEIVDRSLETPYLESDKTRRDTTLGKSILNLRYNGGRGEYDYPKHPEMFIGFMDHDPRGVENVPRMEQYGKQINHRMPPIEIRMGNNDTNHTHERPWSNQSLDKLRCDIQTTLSYNTHVFLDEYDGRALNQNFVNEYDHNKKQLIYKDVLPGTMDNTATTQKTNNQYTTNSTPMVSHDNILSDTLTSFDTSSFKLMTGSVVGSKIKNSRNDQHGNESIININTSTSVPNYAGCNVNKSNNELSNYTFQDAQICKSNYKENKQNNPRLMHAETSDYNFDHNIGKKHYYPSNDSNLINISNFSVPIHTFQHFDAGRHSDLHQSDFTKYRDMQQHMPDDIITINKSHNYIFSDDISKKFHNTDVYTYDGTTETQIRSIIKPQHECKVRDQTNNDWSISDENNTSKSQKQIRTGGTVDPTIYEIPETSDFEVGKHTAVMGKKSIRGDRMENDISYGESINYDIDY